MLTEEYLLRKQKSGVNIIGGVCAVMLDMGFTPKQCGWMLIQLVQGNFSGASFEGAQQKSQALQKLPMSFISYEGQPLRQSPRAQHDSKK